MFKKVIVVAALTAWSCHAASAGLIITAQDAMLPFSASAQSGTFEIFLQSTEPAPPDVVGFQLRLVLSPAAAGVSFSSFAKPTLHPYLFGPASPAGAIQPGGAVVDGGDFLLSGSAPLVNGVGLFKVAFQVNGGTSPGNFAIAISTNPSQTFLTNSEMQNLRFTTHNGTIQIVPEPGSLSLCAGGAVGIAIWYRRQRRTSRWRLQSTSWPRL